MSSSLAMSSDQTRPQLSRPLYVNRSGLPIPPVEIADEVEKYAREHGRHGSLRFVPTVLKGRRPVKGTWRVELSLRMNDQRRELYQTGAVPEEPAEIIWLHEPDPKSPTGYRPYDIMQMGAGGVRQFLEKGNMWSGRGQYTSLEQQITEIDEHNETVRRKNYEAAKLANRQMQEDRRRARWKIPFIPVLISFGKNGRAVNDDTSTTTQET